MAEEVRRINDDLPDDDLPVHQGRNHPQRESTPAGKSHELRKPHGQSKALLRQQKTTREKPAEQMGIVTLEHFRGPSGDQKPER